MTFDGGRDMRARDGPVWVIADHLSSRVPQQVRNEVQSLITLLEPLQEPLPIVVESPFKWYWLGDGLQAAGYEGCLAHTLGLSRITGAKVNTDRRDALALATFLTAGMMPHASGYPKASRPIRELLR
jgi:transposase